MTESRIHYGSLQESITLQQQFIPTNTSLQARLRMFLSSKTRNFDELEDVEMTTDQLEQLEELQRKKQIKNSYFTIDYFY